MFLRGHELPPSAFSLRTPLRFLCALLFKKNSGLRTQHSGQSFPIRVNRRSSAVKTRDSGLPAASPLRLRRVPSIIGGVKNKRKTLLKLGAVALLISVYPLSVLFYTWGCVLRSDLEGGRHGPLDAYRHALASAVVSYTLGERPVRLVTRLMESRGKDSNAMDTRNNRIGARIGIDSTSFRNLEPTVRQAVSNGSINSTNTNQITWLPKEKWKSGRLW